MRRALGKTLRGRRGFTLLEAVLAVALTALVFTAVAALLPALGKSYFTILDTARAKQLANNVADGVEGQLSYVRTLTISEDGTTAVYTDADGAKTLPDADRSAPGKPVIPGLAYDDKAYMDDDTALSFTLEGDVCTVAVTVSRGERTLCAMTRSFRVVKTG